MKPRAADFLALPADARRAVHLALCEHALRRFRLFASSRKHVQYIDSVVGMRHEVDPTLPADALASVRAGVDTAKVEKRYAEPIVAMQDGDLAFPKEVEYAYYALYNLFRKYVLGGDIDDWLIVNQAVSSEPDESRWAPMLQEAIRRWAGVV